MLSPASYRSEFLSLSLSEERKTVTLVCTYVYLLKGVQTLSFIALFFTHWHKESLPQNFIHLLVSAGRSRVFNAGFCAKCPAVTFEACGMHDPHFYRCTLVHVHFFFYLQRECFSFVSAVCEVVAFEGKDWRGSSYPPSSWNPSSSSRCSARVDSRSR